MDSVKEIILALTILVGGGLAASKINASIRSETVKTTQKGLRPLSGFTSKLTKISPQRLEQGYLD